MNELGSITIHNKWWLGTRNYAHPKLSQDLIFYNNNNKKFLKHNNNNHSLNLIFLEYYFLLSKNNNNNKFTSQVFIITGVCVCECFTE